MRKLILIALLCASVGVSNAKNNVLVDDLSAKNNVLVDDLSAKKQGSTAQTNASTAVSGAKTSALPAENVRKFSFAVTAAMLEIQAIGYYNLTEHWAVGAGTGIMKPQKLLIPVFADVRYQIGRERRFTPFLEAAAGYSFAPAKSAHGGMFVNPSVGVAYRLKNGMGLQIALGWQIQKLERRRQSTDQYFHSEFVEKLTNSHLSLRLGVTF